jgi:hypothetical protein
MLFVRGLILYSPVRACVRARVYFPMNHRLPTMNLTRIRLFAQACIPQCKQAYIQRISYIFIVTTL